MDKLDAESWQAPPPIVNFQDEPVCRTPWQPPVNIATRAVVADDARTIRPLVYRSDSIVAVVMLDAAGALGLAAGVVDAARRHLPPVAIIVNIDPALAKV